jgi:isoprenylcysteine carboxyl methyltransferase (ICMT) family protein YpbQ
VSGQTNHTYIIILHPVFIVSLLFADSFSSEFPNLGGFSA